MFVCLLSLFDILIYFFVSILPESFRWFPLARWMQKMLLHWNAWHAEPAAAVEKFGHETPILGRRDDFERIIRYDLYILNSTIWTIYTVFYCILSLHSTLRKSSRFLKDAQATNSENVTPVFWRWIIDEMNSSWIWPSCMLRWFVHFARS